MGAVTEATRADFHDAEVATAARRGERVQLIDASPSR